MRGAEHISTASWPSLCGTLVLAAALAGTFTVLVAAADARQPLQDQQAPPSLGDLARHARAEKQQAPPPKKVWTNENIPTNPSAISVIGPPTPPPAPAVSAEDKAAADAAKPAAPLVKEMSLAQLQAALPQAKDNLATMEKELDLAKRDYVLQQQAFYTNPMASQDDAGQAQLAQVQQQIDTKQQEVDKQKAYVEEMEQRFTELGGSLPAPPAPPAGGSSPSSPTGSVGS